MSILFPFLLLCLFSINLIESDNLAAATFDVANTGIDGWIQIFNGKLFYELDFTDFDFDLLPDNCTDDGFQFLLHTKWTYNENEGDVPADRMLEECHSNFTGASFDPWFACGPISASSDCVQNGGCIPPSSVFEESDLFDGGYTCDPENYDLVSYTCESGDWSGKYGNLFPFYYSNITNDTEGEFIDGIFHSYWELSETFLMPDKPQHDATFSLVIHCSDGTPAVCAPVVRGQNANIPEITLTDTELIEISFEEAGEEFDNFTVLWDKQGLIFNIPQSIGEICSEWNFKLYETYPYSEGIDAVTAAVDCDTDDFGGIYDPTHTCVQDSGSAYCINGLRCNKTDANYDCSGDFRGCAVGDISARSGSIVYDTGLGGTQQISLTDPMSPPLFILDARGIVMECLFNASIMNVCSGTICENCTSLAPINNITKAPSTQTLVPSMTPSKTPSNQPTEIPTLNPTIITTEEKKDEDQDEKKEGLETGAVIGIVVGAIIILIVIVVAIFCCLKKNEKDENVQKAEMGKMKSASADGDETTAMNA